MKARSRVVLLVDLAPSRRWLLESGLLRATATRLSQDNAVHWHFQRPTFRLRERQHYELRKQLAKLVVRLIRRARRPLTMLRTYWRLLKAPGYDKSIQRLVAEAGSSQTEWLILVMGHHAAVLTEGIELGLRLAEEKRADLLHCSTVDGILPTVVSVAFLKRLLERDPTLDARLLETPAALSDYGKVIDVQLSDASRFPGQIRCWPRDEREQILVQFWKVHRAELAAALKEKPEIKGPGREKLAKLLMQYRETLVPGLETYHITGEINDLHALRRRMRTSGKPVLDYFVIATHFKRFLQQYAGLAPASHVLDIGCSWGYLGIILAGYLDAEGAYAGVEVQSEPIAWARKRLGWLGDNYRFHHLDVYNDLYNREASLARDQVKLPIEDGWADVIWIGSVFTHMQEDGVQSYFNEFQRMLRPGGIAAFSYRDSSSFWSMQQTHIGNKRIPDKTTVFSRERIESMLDKADLEIARPPVNMRQFGRTEYQTCYFATPRKRPARGS